MRWTYDQVTVFSQETHPHFHEEEDALGYESFGCEYGDLSFDHIELEKLFLNLNVSGSITGDIVRAKGIFRIGERWILMELASGEYSSQPVKAAKKSKVSVIGKGLDRKMIGVAFNKCLSG